jgi:non-ribosomal peptide synthetase component E (peptide arylation enzyme)
MKSPNNNNIEYEMSGLKMAYPNSTIQGLFKEHAEIYPNSIALEFEDKQVTYNELNKTTDTIVDLFLEQVDKTTDEIPIVYK